MTKSAAAILGKKGGLARAKKSKALLSAIGKLGAAKRWANHVPKPRKKKVA